MENGLLDLIENKDLWISILNSLYSFFENDKELIENKVHEQAIAHRLAVYLEYWNLSFNESNKYNLYNIDCEYNKNKDIINKKFSVWNEEIWKENIIIKNGKWKCNIINFHEKSHYICIYIEKQKAFIGTLENNIISKKSEYMRPDIVIHSRWDNDKNLCLFEIKKWKNLDDKDIIKLRWFTKKNFWFNYNHWIWLYNFQENSVNIDLYKDWKFVQKYTYIHLNWIKKES